MNAEQFLRGYVESHENAYQEALDYIEKRGWVDGTAIDYIMEGVVRRDFAHMFKQILDFDGESTTQERIGYVLELLNNVLADTTLHNSTSMGSNMLGVSKIKEAQAILRNAKWWQEVDEAGKMIVSKNMEES